MQTSLMLHPNPSLMLHPSSNLHPNYDAGGGEGRGLLRSWGGVSLENRWGEGVSGGASEVREA